MKFGYFVSGIILAAGTAKRFGEDKLAQVLPNGNTVLDECIQKFEGLVDELLLVLNKERRAKFKSKRKLDKLKIVIGGATRQESAFLAAKATNLKSELLCIHDAARPFVSKQLLEKSVYTASKFGTCIPIVKIVDTVKQIKDGKVEKTLDRNKLFRVQTPQVFFKKEYLELSERFKNNFEKFNDDSQLFEAVGLEVNTIEGENSNIKITKKEDMLLANFIIKSNLKLK